MQATWMRWVFASSAVYDGLLGLVFLFWADRVFGTFGVPPPNHYGYVQFPAILLLVFAAMFAQIAAAPRKRRELIPYGMGLKAAYCGVTFYHFLFRSIPWMWMPFAFADLIFLGLFLAIWMKTSAPVAQPEPLVSSGSFERT